MINSACEYTVFHEYEYITKDDTTGGDKLPGSFFLSNFSSVRAELFYFYISHALSPQNLFIKQFNDVYRYFFISGNSLICLGPRIKFKFSQRGELLTNEVLILKVAEYYSVTAETLEFLKGILVPLLEPLFSLLRITKYTNYHEAYLKYLYATGSLSIVPFEFPYKHFLILENVLYYTRNFPPSRYEVVSTSTFSLMLSEYGGKDAAFCIAHKLYEALFDLLKSHEKSIHYESVYYTDPDIPNSKFEICFQNNVNKFEDTQLFDDSFPQFNCNILSNSPGKITPAVEKLFTDISNSDIKQIELLAELYARIAAISLPSKFLWIIEGTHEEIINFNKFLLEQFSQRVISCIDIPELCSVKSLCNLLNGQANGNLAVISYNGKCEFHRTNHRFCDILKGNPIKGSKNCLWNKSFPVNMVFIYCAENSKQVLDKFKYIPTKTISISHFNYFSLKVNEMNWIKKNLILLGLKKISEHEYKVPKGMNDFEQSLMDFAQSRCSFDSNNNKGNYTTGGDLYMAYKEYCVGKGYLPLGKTSFLKRFSDKYKLKYIQNRQCENKKVVWGTLLKPDDNKQNSEKIKSTSSDFLQALNEIFSFEVTRGARFNV